jgi:hypothetical protein
MESTRLNVQDVLNPDLGPALTRLKYHQKLTIVSLDFENVVKTVFGNKF